MNGGGSSQIWRFWGKVNHATHPLHSVWSLCRLWTFMDNTSITCPINYILSLLHFHPAKSFQFCSKTHCCCANERQSKAINLMYNWGGLFLQSRCLEQFVVVCPPLSITIFVKCPIWRQGCTVTSGSQYLVMQCACDVGDFKLQKDHSQVLGSHLTKTLLRSI